MCWAAAQARLRQAIQAAAARSKTRQTGGYQVGTKSTPRCRARSQRVWRAHPAASSQGARRLPTMAANENATSPPTSDQQPAATTSSGDGEADIDQGGDHQSLGPGLLLAAGAGAAEQRGAEGEGGQTHQGDDRRVIGDEVVHRGSLPDPGG